MKRITLALLFVAFLGFIAKGIGESPSKAHNATALIPRVTDFSFNERWINPALCGRRFWCAANANGPTADQTMDIRRLAWTANSEEQVILATQTNPESPAKFPWLRARLDLVAKGEVPVTHVVMRSKPHWDESTRQILWGKTPTDARYVRITTTLNTAHGGAQLVEFEVYGDEEAVRVLDWKKKNP